MYTTTQLAAMQATTRACVGAATVPATKLHTMQGSTGAVKHNGKLYSVVRVAKCAGAKALWYCTGDYTEIL